MKLNNTVHFEIPLKEKGIVAYNLVYKSIEILSNEGWVSFWRNFKIYINRSRNSNKSRTKYNPKKIVLKQYKEFGYNPKISIIMPTWNSESKWLKRAIDSLLAQYYENWELCIADGGSTDRKTRAILQEYAYKDKRIKIKLLSENRGISLNSNEALSLAQGEYIGFLDHDDELTPDALIENISALNEHRDADLIYSDHAKIDKHDYIYDEEFKPGWSPELLLSYCYIGHFKLIRKSLLDEVGWFRKEYDGSQDYDLLLRLSERTNRIYHIPQILYLWRATKRSVALATRSKPSSIERGREAVQAALMRRGIPGHVVLPEFAIKNGIGIYKPILELNTQHRVTIIIPTKDNIKRLKRCIDSVEWLTSYKNYDIILIDNGSEDIDTLEYLKMLEKKYKILKFPTAEFNFSRLINLGVREAESEFLILLNDDTEVITPGWIEEMLGWLNSSDSIGAVGCKLIYEDGRIQHAGVILGMCGNPADHAFKLQHYEEGGYLNYCNVVRNYSAVTGACMMVKKSLFVKVGKFDEYNLPVSFNDIDYCLKLIENGCRVVYTPNALLYHHEGSSRGTGSKTDRPEEVHYFLNKYEDQILNDKYYNKNLSLSSHSFKYKSEERIVLVTHNLNTEGAPIFLLNLALGLKDRGYILKVISPVDGPLKFDFAKEGIDVEIVKAKDVGIFIHRHGPRLVLINTITTYEYIDSFKQHDIGIPIIWVIHESEKRIYLTKFENLNSRHFNDVSAVAFVSNKTREAYEDLNVKDNFVTIYNGIDTNLVEEFIHTNDRSVARKNLDFPENAFIITTVGVLCERKDQETFVKAAIDILRNSKTEKSLKVCFIMVGARRDMPSTSEYINKIIEYIKNNNLGEYIKIVYNDDALRREDILNYYLISDLYVCTSRIEAFPLTILEAMSFGLPIISTDVFGIKEQIENEKTGIFFEQRSYTDLSKKIRKLMENSTLMRDLGDNARCKVKKDFNMNKMLNKYEYLMIKTLSQANKAAAPKRYKAN